MAIAPLFVDSNKTLNTLFNEFQEKYLSSPKGQRRAHQYKPVHQQGRVNYAKIENALAQGTDVTELAIRSLLPHADSVTNRQRGSWLHVRADVQGSEDKFFEVSWRINPRDFPALAKALIRFVRHCVAEPSRLPVFADEFTADRVTQGFDAVLLSPILNALRPDSFCVANVYTARVSALLTGSRLELDLSSYSKLNRSLRNAVDKLITSNDKKAGNMSACDLFDLFSYWLIEVKGVVPEELNKNPITPRPAPSPAPIEAVSPIEIVEKREPVKEGDDSYFELAEQTALPPKYFKRLEKILKRKGQVILSGPPGTGKTFVAENFAKAAASKSEGRWSSFFVDESKSSEDLAESLALFTMSAPREKQSYFVIFGANGESLGKLLGPLLRAFIERDKKLELPGGREFILPSSVAILITMCSNDDSLGKLKSSLAQRFAILPLHFRPALLRMIHKDKQFVEALISLIENVNSGLPNWRCAIGHGPFLVKDIASHIEDIWSFEIEPYLERFISDEELSDLRWSAVRTLLQQ